jgi:electron transfer flavoprotein alpha subunit
MKILVIAEHDNTNLNLSSSNAISAAKQLGENISVLVIGNDCDDVAESVARISGVREVLLASHEVYKDLLPENLVPTIAKLAADTSHVVAPATTFGKNLMPGVAALLDVSQISDVIEIKASDTFVRPIYAGNAIATVQSADQVKVLTVRTTAFAPSPPQDIVEITACDIVTEQSKALSSKKSSLSQSVQVLQQHPLLSLVDEGCKTERILYFSRKSLINWGQPLALRVLLLMQALSRMIIKLDKRER